MTTSTRWPNEHYAPTLNRALEEFFRRAGAPGDSGEEDVTQSTWTPAVDVKETDSALTLFIELPGIGKDDINISLENRVLTVSGERRFEQDDRDSYRRVERSYGKFTRSFRVPADIDGNRVTAGFSDGVLKLELPKTEAAKPRQIKIN